MVFDSELVLMPVIVLISLRTSLGVLCILEAWSLSIAIMIGGCLECWIPCGSVISSGLLVAGGLDGATESKEGICVHFGYYALRQVSGCGRSRLASDSFRVVLGWGLGNLVGLLLAEGRLPSRVIVFLRLFQVLATAVVILVELSRRLILKLLLLGSLRRELELDALVLIPSRGVPDLPIACARADPISYLRQLSSSEAR
ncbi:hypothetical protein GIB67_034158 [Kingdonia uniflora]|uniref:Uncharacterized protein n=1 Tax=Kingdonia uniflora TaxID=39325 RepID=A0A7J7LS67_9MAGN|nr:hypothetical protein GIB67_034158 [Kingdonia uniflora]